MSCLQIIEKLLKDINSIDKSKLHTITVKQNLLLNEIAQYILSEGNPKRQQTEHTIPDGYVSISSFLERWPIIGESTLCAYCGSKGQLKDHAIKVAFSWFLNEEKALEILEKATIYRKRSQAIKKLKGIT